MTWGESVWIVQKIKHFFENQSLWEKEQLDKIKEAIDNLPDAVGSGTKVIVATINDPPSSPSNGDVWIVQTLEDE